MLEKCRFCGSKELDPIEPIHKCPHIEVVRVVCLDCGKEDIDLIYPSMNILPY